MGRSLAELLAPAGSYESMVAAIHGGADAVYIGGSSFGARAYAQNPEEKDLIQAIRYAHLHNRKIYLTVNTLMKEEELEGQLYEFLAPFYQEGLDAVIVQDMGTFCYIREYFPDMPIHVSTQMTITGEMGAKILEEMGASRIVTARELSFEEIKKIRRDCELEIESFVHGALCYCYSGQCLFSSLAGGRSGNRGRCAQPCRLSYQVKKGNQKLTKSNEGFLLSLKDLNTLEILPEIIEAGVTSLKIEGRMKKPEYTAGVVSIYRKYLDDYLLHGKESYQVERKDQKNLFNLFNRKGFTEGYYQQHNGKSMLTRTKPDFRSGGEEYYKQLREYYLNTELKEKIQGKLTILQDFPVKIKLRLQDISVEIQGEFPTKAKNRPLTRDMAERQIKKTGNTPFSFDSLEIELEDGLFLSVVQLNDLRRRALEVLEEAVGKRHQRQLLHKDFVSGEEQERKISFEKADITASVETWEQLEEVLQEPCIQAVYVDSLLAQGDAFLAERVHRAGKKCFLMLPGIFRTEAKPVLRPEDCKRARFDGYLLRTIEEIGWIKRNQLKGRMIADHMLYSYNHRARQVWKELGMDEDTVPIELNAREICQRGASGSEMIVYGRFPMMISAQCIQKTIQGCDRKQNILTLTDRLGNEFPVKNYCEYCYNVIYNSKPLSLLDMAESVKKLNLRAVRLSFTVESGKETRNVLKLFCPVFGRGEEMWENISDFTRGHYKRGVE